jgi:integrase
MSKGPKAQSKGTTKRGEYKGYWLTQVAGSPYWYRTRYDSATQQNERVSLGETSYDAAVVALISYVDSQLSPENRAPETIRLYEVLNWYWENHGKTVIQSNQQKAGIAKWKEHFPEKTVISELVPVRMKKFAEEMQDEGLSLGYIDRIIGVGRAAVYAARDNNIISHCPKIKNCQTEEDRESVDPLGRPLELEELARLFVTCQQPHVLNYMLISVHTMARPAAVLDLAPEQVDFREWRVNMNPKGRRQTKKKRPLLRLTNGLAKALRKIADEYDGKTTMTRYVLFKDKPVKNINRAWAGLVEDAGLAGTNVTLYSIRHTMGRELRDKDVPEAQISLFLGHKVRGVNKVTGVYAPYSPEYLRTAAEVIDAYAERLRAEIARQLTGAVEAAKAA